ncbi:poly(3-hydroxybutyrate) depolymerase [Actinocorallia herbida]|uniref:Poly(3-hydroxybutyrate) depolymerase n=1 Tax=Actinocorallia herbida TaxID=58109 RepID=A0A3N1CUC5_9ACTN|nr:hypothetical protein [Actinocorallia herbida]ROO84910.1 poly(3-hydroxybutyrate) depolymerase [Actinocorallia herbida]
MRPLLARSCMAFALMVAAFSPAVPAAADPAPAPADRFSVRIDGSAYTADGALTSGGFAVTDRVADFATVRIAGRGAFPGPSGGDVTAALDVRRGLTGLTGSFTLEDPGSGVRVKADVRGVTVPEDGTVTWTGPASVTDGPDTARRTVSLTLVDALPDPGDHAIRIAHAGVERRAILRLPDDYDGTPRPVLFHFPGLIEAPWMAEFFGRMADHARTRGYIMITPEHHGRGWQGVPAGTTEPELDDPGFVMRLQDILVERFNADPSRLYASGMSNGGFFTSKLACENTRFAAFAPVSGQLSDIAGCAPTRPVPIVLLHGDGDSVVPYTTAPPAAAFWAGNNGCSTDTETTALPDLDPADRTTVDRITYLGCPADAPVVLYRIRGGGHNWPGGLPFLGPFLGGTTHDITANDVIWDFVTAFHL